MRRQVLTTALCSAVVLSFGLTVLAEARSSARADEKAPAVLFRESFDDSQLLQRDWYDGSKFQIAKTKP